MTIIKAAEINKLDILYCVGLDGYDVSDIRHIETKTINSNIKILKSVSKNNYGIPVVEQQKLNETFFKA